MPAMSKEHRTLAKRLRQQGFTLTQSKASSHWKIYKGAQLITTFPCSPSDRRGYQNLIARLRRSGYTEEN